MKHLAEAYTTVESILITEEEIEDEIDRQEEVIKQANSDAREAEKDIDDTSHMLKNIKSLGGKFSNLIHGHHGHKSANVMCLMKNWKLTSNGAFHTRQCYHLTRPISPSRNGLIKGWTSYAVLWMLSRAGVKP